jgi:phage terminase large subunit
MPKLDHQYHPRGAAQQLFGCRDPIVVLSGPAGTGKSRAALEKCLLMALMNKGSRGLFMRKTLVSLTQTGIVTWKSKVIPEALTAGVVKFFGGSRDEPPAYQFTNGSTIAMGGMDNPDKIMSSEYDWIFVQEGTELSRDDAEKATSRLRNGVMSFQQLIIDCNPNVPTHWLKQLCDAGGATMLYSKHTDNPMYYDDNGELTPLGRDYIEGKLAKLTGVRRLRLYEGKWASAEGVVYEHFDASLHIIDEMPAGWESWQRLWTVDFGFRNPFVCQFWARSPDDELYLYREIYMSGRIVEDHARQILTTVRKPLSTLDRPPRTDHPEDWEWTEPRPRAIVCDHDAEDRATLERHLDMPTEPASKSIKPGIELCQARYRPNELGRAGIYFLRTARLERDVTLADAGRPTSTIEEIPGYCWPDGVRAEAREVPVKADDHGMDAKRYGVMYYEESYVPRVRFI